jgi:uracil permease
MENMRDKDVHLTIGIKEKPEPLTWLFLSIQHVFAMFGATILVPMLTGYPVSVALFASGIGTLIYTMCTKKSVPVYLGSSFAYIAAVQIAVKAMHGSYDAAQTGLILVGVIYCVVGLIVKFTGEGWIDKLLPPIVIGPMIAVIGLSLASNAVSNAGFVSGGNWKEMLVAVLTFLIAAFVSTKAKGFLKIVPFLVAIAFGYALSAAFGLVDFSNIAKASWFRIPEFILPFKVSGFKSYNFYFGPETLAILPVALVTISEHIGDHTVLGKICGKNFLKDPGLHRTLTGDGLATAVSALIGGPANTTYGENTGVIGMTKVGSVYVTCGAACIAILLSFSGKIAAVISSIPSCVLGGMSILLYGVIASNGLRVLVDNNIDFSKQRNLVIASAMLVLGLGGAVLPISASATLSGTALAAIVGIVLNLIIPKEKKKNE